MDRPETKLEYRRPGRRQRVGVLDIVVGSVCSGVGALLILAALALVVRRIQLGPLRHSLTAITIAATMLLVGCFIAYVGIRIISRGLRDQ